MTVKVKICGLKTREAIIAAQDNGADFLGFIFAENSPRYITPIEAEKITKNATAKKVAVVVDATDEQLSNIILHLNPDYIQLHGSEHHVRAMLIKDKFKLPLIKAVTPDNYPTVTQLDLFDYLLIDSPNGGGSGKSFNWRHFNPPHGKNWFLSGGLNAGNLAEAVKATGAQYIDVSSGVESTRGVKDIQKIKEFLQIAKNLTPQT